MIGAGGGEKLAAEPSDLAAATERADNLEVALVNSRRIGMAMGILMERHRMTVDQAFDQLRVISSRRNVKLSEVAAEIVYTGGPRN